MRRTSRPGRPRPASLAQPTRTPRRQPGGCWMGPSGSGLLVVGYPGSRVAMDVGVFGTPRGFVDRHGRVVAQSPGTWSSAVDGHRRPGPGWHCVPPRRVAARAVGPAVTTWVGRAGGLTWRGSRPASGGPAGGSQLTRCRRFLLRGARDTAAPAGGRPAAATCAETTAAAPCGFPRSSALAVSLVHSTPDRPGLTSPTIYPRGITRRDHRPLPGPSADRHKIAGWRDESPCTSHADTGGRAISPGSDRPSALPKRRGDAQARW